MREGLNNVILALMFCSLLVFVWADFQKIILNQRYEESIEQHNRHYEQLFNQMEQHVEERADQPAIQGTG